MRKLLLSSLLLLSLGVSVAQTQGKHRHTPQTEAAATTPDNAEDGLTAYSDTTSLDASAVDSTSDASDEEYYFYADEDNSSQTRSFNLANYDDPISAYFALWSFGFGGVILALLFTLMFLLFFVILPIVLLYLVIRIIIKYLNSGTEPKEGEPVERRTVKLPSLGGVYDRTKWEKGIRNTALGIGLMVMFGIWGADPLVGVGALITCLGIGQLIIARTSSDHNDRDDAPNGRNNNQNDHNDNPNDRNDEQIG